MSPKLDPKRLAAQEPIKLAGEFFRIVQKRYSEDLTGITGSLLSGGRYNPRGEFGALYLGESEELCKAELAARVSALASLKAGIWVCGRIQVMLERVLDLTYERVLKQLGVKPQQLTKPRGLRASGYWLTRRIGRLARAAGFEGLKVPSATSRGANLVIFPENLSDSSQIAVVEKYPATFESEA